VRTRIQNVSRKRLVLRVLVCTLMLQLQLPCTSIHCHIPKYMYYHNNIHIPLKNLEFMNSCIGMYWTILACTVTYCHMSSCIMMYSSTCTAIHSKKRCFTEPQKRFRRCLKALKVSKKRITPEKLFLSFVQQKKVS
jgi:hypothetical protein